MIDKKNALKILEANFEFLFITRSSSLIHKQLLLLIKSDNEITETKKNYILQKDEKNANMWLSIESLCKSIIAGMELFLALKENKPDNAWLRLIDAQNYIHWSNTAYGLSGDIQKQLIMHFHNIEKVIFPPQRFQSISITTKESICSICKKKFHECDHIREEPYMGEFCTEIVTKIGQFRHLAVVEHPADKKCRITHFGDTNPPRINYMTLEKEPEEATNHE